MKSGNLNFLEPSGPLQACNGTALPLFYMVYILFIFRPSYNTKSYNSKVDTMALRKLNSSFRPHKNIRACLLNWGLLDRSIAIPYGQIQFPNNLHFLQFLQF